jgi:hypothetical protein
MLAGLQFAGENPRDFRAEEINDRYIGMTSG